MKGPRVLVVDPIRCNGNGLCAELLPERVTLDDWGYPMVDATPIVGALVGHARRAVSSCPVLALRLEPLLDSAFDAPADPGRRDGPAA